MKELIKLTFNKVFFSIFFVLVTLIILSSVANDKLISDLIASSLIPVLFISFFVKQKSLNIAFILFLVFAFMGDISFMFFHNEMHTKVSGVIHLIGFLYLVGMLLPKLKVYRLDKVISGYLIMVFCISLYFLYCLSNALNLVISDNDEIMVFAVKNLALIILAFTAFGVYLSTLSRRSVLFLTGVILLAFSVILDYINIYYIYHWSFEMLDKIMYASSLYFMFKYMSIENRTKTGSITEINENYVLR